MILRKARLITVIFWEARAWNDKHHWKLESRSSSFSSLLIDFSEFLFLTDTANRTQEPESDEEEDGDEETQMEAESKRRDFQLKTSLSLASSSILYPSLNSPTKSFAWQWFEKLFLAGTNPASPSHFPHEDASSPSPRLLYIRASELAILGPRKIPSTSALACLCIGNPASRES